MYTLNCYKHRLIARLLARRTTFARGCNVSVSKSNFMLTGHLYCTFRLRELTRKTHSTNLLASALEFGLVRAPRRNKTDTLPRGFLPRVCPVSHVCTSMYVCVYVSVRSTCKTTNFFGTLQGLKWFICKTSCSSVPSYTHSTVRA